MSSRIVFALLLLLPVWGGCTRPGPTRQLANSLVIDTPQFAVTVPGQWRPDTEGLSGNLLYSGVATDGPITRRFFVNVYLIKEGQGEAERRAGFVRFVQGRKENEDRVTNYEQRFIDEQTRQSDDLLVGGYVGIHPAAHRVAFSRDMADRKLMVHIGYEVAGFRVAPDLAALVADFDKIVKSARIKSSNHQEPPEGTFLDAPSVAVTGLHSVLSAL